MEQAKNVCVMYNACAPRLPPSRLVPSHPFCSVHAPVFHSAPYSVLSTQYMRPSSIQPPTQYSVHAPVLVRILLSHILPLVDLLHLQQRLKVFHHQFLLLLPQRIIGFGEPLTIVRLYLDGLCAIVYGENVRLYEAMCGGEVETRDGGGSVESGEEGAMAIIQQTQTSFHVK